MADIVGLVASVLQLLDTQVDKRIQGGSPAGADALKEFKEPLTRLNTIMQQLTKKVTPASISKATGRRLVWPLWGKKDAEEGLRTIERLKTLLNSWVGMGIL
ncbi:hypothetical protein C8R44DRAFT_749356 [Mycena epipterygia]|nr:hypothetical protein C8R44DRAFT_749356 [Mycena epipterygia]